MRWFDECRYGMFVHANIATVPAFAPVHEYADWYWAFLETKPDMVLHPTCPLPEVVAWHAEHAGGHPFDRFVDQLTFERFDADDYVQLLEDAGMRYLVHVTKHHDGFCWWNTAHSDRSSVHLGPKRDVTAELADAVRRRGHIFGCYYSLLDWSHPAYPDEQRYVDAYMRPQIKELVERFEPALLWGDGHWGHSGPHWRSDQILADARAVAAERGFDLVVNDRWFASSHDYAVYEYDVPDVSPPGRWELCRGLGYSFCVNRNERVEDHLSAAQVVALLVETVAKGGNLLLNVGPNADGTVPDLQAQVLRDAGVWIRAHSDAIHGSTRFDMPGEGQHWLTRAGGHVQAFDLSSSPEPRFAGLDAAERVCAADGTDLAFRVESGVLAIDARTLERHPYGSRYVIELGVREHTSLVDRSPAGAARAGRRYATITEALAGAAAGDCVDVGPGRYTRTTGETFPLVVPAGVTVRAAASLATSRVVIDAGGVLGVHLAGDDATLERLTVTDGAPGYMMVPPTCVISRDADRVVVRDCHVQSIMLTGGAGHHVTGNVITNGAVSLMGATGCEVRANYQHGLRWGVGIMIAGGADHVVAENECCDDLCAIRLANTDRAHVDHNRVETRWWGIHLLDARHSVLRSNKAWHTMRAVDVEGSNAHTNVIERQLAEHCDTGTVIQRGANETRVVDSWFHDCRVGVLVWEAGSVDISATAISAPRDHAVIADHDLDLVDNDLDGDVWIA
jgi:alpha-L-fucosidase